MRANREHSNVIPTGFVIYSYLKKSIRPLLCKQRQLEYRSTVFYQLRVLFLVCPRKSRKLWAQGRVTTNIFNKKDENPLRLSIVLSHHMHRN